MEWATLVWMGGMTVIAVAVERRTSRLEKKLDERQNKPRDAAKVPYQPDSSAMQRDKCRHSLDGRSSPSEHPAEGGAEGGARRGENE